MENIEGRLRKVLIEYGIDQAKLNENSDYYFDLNLDLIGLVRNIKKEFRINIPDSEIFRMESVSNTICFLEKKSNMMLHHN